MLVFLKSIFNAYVLRRTTRGLALLLFTGLILETGCNTDATSQRIREQLQHKGLVYIVRSDNKQKAILFVHGVFGDPISTWVNNDTKKFWPFLLRDDKDFKEFDIYSVGYDTPLFERTSSIEEVGVAMLQDLKAQKLFTAYEEIYLVTHSMGGLIGKHILVDLNTPTEYTDLDHIRSIIFLATPSQGAEVAGLAKWFSFNPQLKAMESALQNDSMQQLDNRWDKLIDERNKQNRMFPKSFCAYETKNTFWISIVNRGEAKTVCDDPPSRAFTRNHIAIVKPAGEDDEIYIWVKDKISKAASLTPALTAVGKENEITQLVSAMLANYSQEFYEGAEQNADEILQMAPNHIRALSMKGTVAFYNGDFQVAVEYFKKALRTKPGNRALILNLADGYMEIGGYTLAIDLYRSIEDGKVDWSYAMGRGNLYMDAYPEALKYLEVVPSEFERGAGRVLEAAALVGLATKEGDPRKRPQLLSKAEETLREAVNRDPQYWDAILRGKKRDIHQSFAKANLLLEDIYGKMRQARTQN